MNLIVTCLVLLSIGRAEAAHTGLCTTTVMSGTDTCVCPGGTGKTIGDTRNTALGGSTSLDCTAAGTIFGGSVTAGTDSPASIASCDSLLTGYALVVGASSTTTATVTSTAVACPAGYYCAGSATLVNNGVPTSSTAVVRGTADGATACVGATRLGGTSAMSSSACVNLDVCGQGAPTSFFGTGAAVTNTDDVQFGTTSAGSFYSCTCPAGTGEITAISAGTALPAKIATGATGISGLTVPASSIATYAVTAFEAA